MGYKDDCEEEARVLAEAERQAEAQRQQERNAQQELMSAIIRQKREQAEREDRRMEAEDKRQDENMRTLLDHQRKIQEANRDRADQLQKNQDQNLKDVIKEGSDVLDKQRNFNQAEIKNRVTDHQNLITRTKRETAETEQKAEEKVTALKGKKEELQTKLNDDRKEYHEKKMEVQKQHALDMEKHTQETANLQLKREKNEIAHGQTMAAITAFAQATRNEVALAAVEDVTENNFADSVSNTRDAALAVSRGVTSMERHALSLRKGKPAPPKLLNVIKVVERNLYHSIETLRTAVSRIRDQQETRNPKTTECQEIAFKIGEIEGKLSSALTAYGASIEGSDPIDNSPQLFQTVQQKNRELQKLVSSLPSITKSQHAIGVLVKSTQSIQLGSNYIQQSQTVAAILND
ncbi:hypothetical protein L3Y34_007376 [Caenorhabditis briggsae]|uniref:Uncharacterized protein n=1 Tax=Caenorhabditis briggsae TaxID=6238 RepID=A0AAE8ZWP0_CAEBR|nr:hypothetical protein L3Y34_007376 [Caenorhabditis briggsae]